MPSPRRPTQSLHNLWQTWRTIEFHSSTPPRCLRIIAFASQGHTLNNQYYLNDVWFWNMSPSRRRSPVRGSNVCNGWAIKLHGPKITHSYTVPTPPKINSKDIPHIGSGGSRDHYSGRSFHPKDDSHAANKYNFLYWFSVHKLSSIHTPLRHILLSFSYSGDPLFLILKCAKRLSRLHWFCLVKDGIITISPR